MSFRVFDRATRQISRQNGGMGARLRVIFRNPAKHPARMAGFDLPIGGKVEIATRIATSCRDCGAADRIFI